MPPAAEVCAIRFAHYPPGVLFALSSLRSETQPLAILLQLEAAGEKKKKKKKPAAEAAE